MIDETGIISDSWREKFFLHQLVDKSESYLRARRVKDADEKMKDEKKQDRRKPLQIEKDEEQDLQGDARKKRPPDGPPNVKQNLPDLEKENWQNHVKCHILQQKIITDQHLEASLQFAAKFPSECN